MTGWIIAGLVALAVFAAGLFATGLCRCAGREPLFPVFDAWREEQRELEEDTWAL